LAKKGWAGWKGESKKFDFKIRVKKRKTYKNLKLTNFDPKEKCL